jgi:hypothetical protein
MQRRSSKMFIGDLLNCKLVTAEGKLLGHIADIQLTPGPEYRIIALLFGRRGWFYRLHMLNPFSSVKMPYRPRSIPWEAVESYQRPIVRLKPGYEAESHLARPEG